MTRRFRRCLIAVSAVHVVAVLLFMMLPGCRNLFRKKPPETILPIEFLVEVPSAPAPPSPAPRPPAPKPPEPKPPEPKPPEPKPEEPAPVPRTRPPIVPSTTRIRRDSQPEQPPPPRAPTLTPEEIERLLKLGAKPSDRRSIPDEDARCLELIKRAFYAAWTQPVASGGLKAVVTFRLGDGGAILSWTLTSASGNAEFDETVRRAAASVRRVEGLTAGFVARRSTVTIAFTVE